MLRFSLATAILTAMVMGCQPPEDDGDGVCVAPCYPFRDVEIDPCTCKPLRPLGADAGAASDRTGGDAGNDAGCDSTKTTCQ